MTSARQERASTWRLCASAELALAPPVERGHKMMVKGLLIRNPSDTHVNVLALESIAPTCP